MASKEEFSKPREERLRPPDSVLQLLDSAATPGAGVGKQLMGGSYLLLCTPYNIPSGGRTQPLRGLSTKIGLRHQGASGGIKGLEDCLELSRVF
jgi:hypothetical protein